MAKKRKFAKGSGSGSGRRRRRGRGPELQTVRMGQVMDRLKALDEENPVEKPGVRTKSGAGDAPERGDGGGGAE